MSMTKKEYRRLGEILYIGELPNGLRIRVIPKPGFSTYYAVFGTNYGGAMRRFEIDGEAVNTPAGVAHFLEHKMFDMPSGKNALSVFSENGANPNAFTSSSYTCYYFRCTDGFEANLRLLLSFVSTPYFTPETVQKEQGIIGQEIQMGEDSPGSVIYYNLLSLLYQNHPIRDKIAGTIDSIAEITDKILYDCHKVFYAPSNMVLTVEGDVDPEMVYQIAAEILSPERLSIPRADYGLPEEESISVSRITTHMPVNEPQFLIGCRNAKMRLDSGKEDLRERMISSLTLKLFIGSSSPLFSKLYSEGTITNSIDAECDYAAGTSTIYIGAEGSDPEKFLAELLNESERISKEGFDPSFFERTLRSSIGGQLKGFEDFDDTCVGVCLGLLDGYESFDSYELLETITANDCVEWLSANIRPERMAMSIVTPLEK